MSYVKAWKDPDYPEGNWIDEEEWQDSGVEEIFEQVADSYSEEFEGLEEGYFAVYSENDLGCERVIPLEYNGEVFETVNGVFDSNPGKSQRYTPWKTIYSEEGLMNDIEEMDGKLVELDEDHVDTLEKNFGTNNPFKAYESIVAGFTGFFS